MFKFKDSINQVDPNTYNVKIVKAGTHVSIKKYSEMQTRKKIANLYKNYDSTEFGEIFDTKTGEIIEAERFELMYQKEEINRFEYFFTKEKAKYHSLDKLERRLRNKIISLRRSKERIINLVNANVVGSKEHIKFLTLTFKENITDVKKANYEFKKFIKRLNYYLKVNNYAPAKYIAVLENQKRGAIHYHIVLFNVPYIPHEDYLGIWAKGSVFIESLMKGNKLVKIDVENEDFTVDGEVINNIGAYITKTIDYIMKTFTSLTGKLEELENFSKAELDVIFTENAKIFQTSRNLKKPEEVYLDVNLSFKKFINYLKIFYNDSLYENEFETELFDIVNYIFKYGEDMKELDYGKKLDYFFSEIFQD